MERKIFVTGTDTGVGKTVVSYLIAKSLIERGYTVGYYKPVETGCDPDCNDAKLLSSLTGQEINEIVLYRFKEPVAPFVAQQLEGESISVSRIYEHFYHLEKKYDFVVVEGAGGIKVPVTEEEGQVLTYLDIVYELSLPSLVVARAGLGTINHTVLTVEALNSVNCRIKGIILNGYTGESVSERTNPEVISMMTGIDLFLLQKSDNPLFQLSADFDQIIDRIF